MIKNRDAHNLNRRCYYTNGGKVKVYEQVKKYKSKPMVRNRDMLRISFTQAILKTNESIIWYERTGYTMDEIRSAIESKFEKGMTWKNYGNYNWVISFIKPLCKFDLSKKSDIKKAFSITNIVPRWYKDLLKVQNNPNV